MAENGKVNILMVDDQPAKLLSYEAILSDLGENLIKAGSAREALQQLLDNDIAVVLMDVCMPEMDGYELAELIRKHPRCQQTAIILVSAIYMTDFDRLKGYDRGAVDYLPVPIVPSILRAKVTVFADLYRKTKELHHLNRELEQRVAERTAELERFTARLRESEERLRSIVNTAVDAIIVIDEHGAIEGSNAAVERIFGYHPDELVGKNVSVLMPPPYRDEHDRYLSNYLTTGVKRIIGIGREVQGRRKDGHVFPIELAVSEMLVHGRPKFTGIVRDVTERKRLEEERRQLLESERAARAEAERAGRVKDEFLATLSHELRTPLSAILVWSHLLRKGRKDESAIAEGLASIEECARAQNRLIDDLLDMSRVISGKLLLDIEFLDLGYIIEQSIDMVRPAARAKRIEIRQSLDPQTGPVRGDELRLKQVFWNLLSNSVKFSSPNQEVRVSMHPGESCVEVRVSDDGLGIDAKLLPHLFDRFRQGDHSVKRKLGGMGLGLALVKHLVELQGGTVHAESAGEGHGAVFTVRLPLAPAAPNEVRAPVVGPPEEICLAGARILLVDDDPGTCESVKRMLVEYHAEVRTEVSAEDALATLETFTPSILVSDIGLPGMDGYELLREVRQMNPVIAGVPAVAMTAYARPEDRARALEAGYDVHVPKPIDPYELLIVIESLIGRPAESS